MDQANFFVVLSGTAGEAENKSSQKAEKADAQHDSNKAKYELAQGLNAQINTHFLQLPTIQAGSFLFVNVPAVQISAMPSKRSRFTYQAT